MSKIAILGFGTVGSGVLEVLRTNAALATRRAGQPVEVKYICDIRDFGRHVATSNKELVATHGAELLALARKKGVCFLFEASVGGGTPVITPMYQCLAANVLSEVHGIVNGTTNFMLTKMEHEGMDFEEALKLAQSLGYAETIDPSADVDGIDAQRKICILASIMFGRHFYPKNVRARGIRDVSVKDIALAKCQNAAVKLIAWAKQTENGPALGVEPMLVPQTSQLAGVSDVFNAVMVHGDMLGDVMFYGKGAGKLPTASAVVADVLDALRNGGSIQESLFWQDSEPWEGTYEDSSSSDWYVRASGDTAAAEKVFGTIEILEESADEIAFTLREKSDAECRELCEKARKENICVKNVLKWLAH